MPTTLKEIAEYLTEFTLPYEYFKNNQITISHDEKGLQVTYITLMENNGTLNIVTHLTSDGLENISVNYQQNNIIEVLRYMLTKMKHVRLVTGDYLNNTQK